MADVIDFTGGRHCIDCDNQIPPARVQVNPVADRCISCQYDYEQHVIDRLANSRAGIGWAVVKIDHSMVRDMNWTRRGR